MANDRRRGDLAGRPTTQQKWLQQSTTTEAEAILRGMGVLLGLLNPVTALVMLVLVAGGSSLSLKVRRWVAGAGVLGAVAALLLGLVPYYVRPYRELWSAGIGPGDWNTQVASAVSSRWLDWLLGQLPFAVLLGTAIGGCWLVRRTKFAADWRKPEKIASERKVSGVLQKVAAGTDGRKPAKSLTELRIRLGADELTGEIVEIPAKALGMHLFMAGVTGYGKSRSIERLVYELVVSPHARGLKLPFIFADLKADPGLIAAMRGAAHEAGRGFHLVTVNGQGTTYNPIRHGTPEQIRSRIVEALDQVAGGGFSEPHHREAAEEFLLFVVRALDDLVAAGVVEQFPDGRRAWRRDLVDLARLMTLKALGSRVDKFSAIVGAELTEYLEYLEKEAKDLKRSIPGLATRIRNLVSGEGRRVLIDSQSGLDLYAAIHAGDVVLFSLSAAADAKAARQIGTMFLTDLGATGDRLLQEGFGESGRMFFAGVDEFSGLGGATMAGLFARMRAAGGSLFLCTQDLSDLKVVSEEFQRAVLTNTNVMILHRQTASAAEVAELLGTFEAWSETIQVQEDKGLLGSVTAGSGVGSLRQVDKFKVHPNEFKELAQGCAVVMVGFPDDRLYRVRMALAPRFSGPPPVLLDKTVPAQKTEEKAPASLSAAPSSAPAAEKPSAPTPAPVSATPAPDPGGDPGPEDDAWDNF
ncbi:TraM recognition domain-containing protein [Kitasatospora sp. NPDC001660]